MAAIFQLRRGSGSVSLVDGELYINKGPDSLQYAVGEREITLAKLDELNSGSLYIQGGISASGDITASNMFISGNLHISGNLFLGNSGSDTITATGEFTSHIIPNPTDTYNLGSDTKRWGRMFVNSVSASAFTGSLFGMGDPTSFSTSVDLRLDRVEASSSLYDNAMSGSNRLYVSPSGSDSNDGNDPSTPFRTIKAAVESLGAAEYTNTKRYTIYVGSGNYTEQNPIVVPPGVAIVGDTLRTVRLTAANPTKDFFHTHDSNYFYGLRFLDLKYPSFAFSFPCSTATATISGGGISGLTMIHTASGYQNGENVSVIIEGPDASGSVATATATVSGGVLSINMVSNGSGYVAGEKPHISIQAPTAKRPLITTSPYVQNCSSITGPFNTSGTKVQAALPYDITALQIDEQGAGGGIRIDGNLVHPDSPLESFVADAFTQVNQGGPGHLVINKGYAQFVSCFTTFCTYGFKVVSGGFANISNSVIDFGAKGLVSKTYFPQTYNTGSSLQTLTSTVVGAVILQDGAGYTGSVASVTISGGGASVQATAEATVNANGSINEIVILTPGSGYTSQPNLTIAAPTGAGAIQATTIAGKANISGIAAILFQLESGSRGVDVSSNMILNGTDYLVTNVATGSSANERYVTVYPAPPSITTGNNVYFHQLSNISTGGLVMEYVGSGVTYNALPKFGGVPNRNREIVEYAPGRVFYSTVDNIGNLKIGDFFAVNQLTGEVTIDANQFNLSGLSAIGPFKRNGVGVGVVLNEVSNNTTLLNAQGITGEDTVPTQFAIKTYVDTISGSVDTRLDNLELTGSNHETRISGIQSYTSSLKTAIDVTGGNTRILGNLIVDGTQTSLNTTETFIEDKSITLASGSTTSGIADGAGLNIAGANVSMSWEDSNQRLYFNTNIAALGSISSSTIIGLNGASVTTYSTSVDSRTKGIELLTGSFATTGSNLFVGIQRIDNDLQVSGSTYLGTDSLDNIEITGSLRTRNTTYLGGNLTQFGTAAEITGAIELSGNQNINGNLIISGNTYIGNSSIDVFEVTSSLKTQNTTYIGGNLTQFGTAAEITGAVNLQGNETINGDLIVSGNVTIGNSNFDILEITSSLKTKNTAYIGGDTTQFGIAAEITGAINLKGNATIQNDLLVSGNVVIGTNTFDTLEVTSSLKTQNTAYIGGDTTQFGNAAIVTGSIDQKGDLKVTGSIYSNVGINGIINATNGVVSGSSQMVGILESLNSFTGSTYSTFSQSVDTRLDNVEYLTGLLGGGLDTSLQAINLATASLQTFSASALLDLNNLHLYTASTNTRLSRIEESTASLNSFTSSIDTTIKTKLNLDNVVSGSALNVKTFLSLENVTNESKATMFASPTFTGIPEAPTAASNTNSTQIATTAYVQTELNDLIGGANSAFDTLLEISASLASGDSTLNTLVDGKLAKASNLSDLTNTGTARTNLGVAIGSDVQAYNSTLAAVAGGTYSGDDSITTIGTVTAGNVTAILPTGVVSGSSQVTGIGNAQLTNSTISGVSLGSNLHALTIGTGLSGTSYNGSGAVTITNTGVTSITTNTGLSTNTSAAGAVTITNTGVTSITAGTGIGISGGTGGVTISIGQEVATTSNVRFGSIGVGTTASGVSGEIRATGDITAFYSSDIRLKENIQPIQNALEKVESISGNTYDWKEGFEEMHSHKGNDVGVIAQEIEEILPQIVTNRDNGYKAVNYEKIIPLLIEAIKELSAKVKELESK